jgi:hypothetical protein
MVLYIVQMIKVNQQKINSWLLHLDQKKILGRLLSTWAGYFSEFPARWGGSKFSRVLHPALYLDEDIFFLFLFVSIDHQNILFNM